MAVIIIGLTLIGMDADVDADQFGRLMRGMHSQIRDVTFVFEGESRDHEKDQAEPSSRFQGVYSFRSDGATLLDLFKRAGRSDVPGGRDIRAILDEQMERLVQIPDVGEPRVTTQKGGPGSLNAPDSPERILYYWYFLSLQDPASYGYEFQGWETIDGHRCLRVQIARVQDSERSEWPEERLPTFRLWIDLERGGHPLKVEYRKGPNLVLRTDKIQLSRVPFGDGERTWFPVRGETNQFEGTSEDYKDIYSRRPFYTETYAVVDGSIRFNQGLKDDYFTVHREDVAFDDPQLAQMQRTLNAIEPEPRPVVRTDPESVRQRLEEQLAEAERQSELLEASSAARVNRVWMPIRQVGLILFGAALVVGALYWRAKAG